MKVRKIILAAGLMLAAASLPGQAKDSAWTLRFHGAFINSSAESRIDTVEGITGKVDVGGGLGIGAEYRMSDRLGLEISTMFAGLVIGNSIAVGEVISDLELSMMPLTIAVPIHFETGGRVDLYVAPTFSVVRYMDLETRIGIGTVETGWDVDSDAAVGANLGLDIPFGKGKWAFSSSVRFMKTAFEDTDLDPVIVTLGFAYRF